MLMNIGSVPCEAARAGPGPARAGRGGAHGPHTRREHRRQTLTLASADNRPPPRAPPAAPAAADAGPGPG